MSYIRLASPLVLALSLSGCIIPIPVPNGTPGSVVVFEGDPCGAKRLQGFVGQTEATVRGTTFQTPIPVRVLVPVEDPGAPNPERLTFRTDSTGTVVAVECN